MWWETLFDFVCYHPEITVVGAITLIQIAPIKLDPWGALVRLVKKWLVGTIETKIDKMSEKVDLLESQLNEDKALRARTHILRFSDELYDGVEHTKEYFDNVLEDIDMYEKYCDAHPGFKNNKASASIEYIKETNAKLLKEHKFK